MATNSDPPDDTSTPQPPANLIVPDYQSAHSQDAATAMDANQAADLIRQKVARLYDEEPSAQGELTESTAEPPSDRSKHQQFMYDLSTSGKDLAAIQTAWHNYYINLPDNEKHQVWHEFYASNAMGQPQVVIDSPKSAQTLAEHKHRVVATKRTSHSRKSQKLRDIRRPADIQTAVRNTVTADGQLGIKHHLQSLLFGLGMGGLVVIIFLFSFFNEVLIAPFIQPSRVAAATPIIIGANSVAPTTTPEVIIPKINVQIPVDYSETSTNEAVIENDLEDGVVHYPTTVMPGQLGNTAFFGHSSNNIFNQGKYKFAFVLLHTLVNGDTFYLTYNDKVYVYKVISKTVVSPNDVSVLGSIPGQTATATLITCDPPGTSINRLVVVGQQISPDPSTNTAGTTLAPPGSTVTSLPGNGPTLWTQVMSTLTGKAVALGILAALFYVTLRWINKPKNDLKRATLS